jgi:hypothetical protein
MKHERLASVVFVCFILALSFGDKILAGPPRHFMPKKI